MSFFYSATPSWFGPTTTLIDDWEDNDLVPKDPDFTESYTADASATGTNPLKGSYSLLLKGDGSVITQFRLTRSSGAVEPQLMETVMQIPQVVASGSNINAQLYDTGASTGVARVGFKDSNEFILFHDGGFNTFGSYSTGTPYKFKLLVDVPQNEVSAEVTDLSSNTTYTSAIGTPGSSTADQIRYNNGGGADNDLRADNLRFEYF